MNNGGIIEIHSDKGERFFKVARMKGTMPDGGGHRILSKIKADGTIEVASIFEYPKTGKSVTKIQCPSAKEFDKKLLGELIPMMEQKTGFEYEVIDFTPYKTFEEQVKALQTMGDCFHAWKEGKEGKMVPVRIDNPYLLDEDGVRRQRELE